MKIKSSLNSETRGMILAAAAIAIAGACVVGLAQPAPPAALETRQPATQPAAKEATTLTGVIDGYNLNAHGNVESFMIKGDDGKLVQANVSDNVGPLLVQSAAVGQTVTVTLVPDRGRNSNTGPVDHTVYRLTSLQSSDGKPINVDDPASPPGKLHVEGTIAHLNYGHHGSVDGAQLDTGDLVFLGPTNAQRVQMKVGDKLSADGPARLTMSGKHVVDADRVNGVEIRPPGGPAGPDASGPRRPVGDSNRGPGGPRGRRGFGGPGGPPDSNDDRQPPPPRDGPPPRDRQ